MSKQTEYTLKIRYRIGELAPIHTRKIPWAWWPSKSDVYHAVRRLRQQYPQGVQVLGATLERTLLVDRYDIKEI